MHQDLHLHASSAFSIHPLFQTSCQLSNLPSTPLQRDPNLPTDAETPWALPWTMDDLISSSPTTQPQLHIVDHGEMRDLIMI